MTKKFFVGCDIVNIPRFSKALKRKNFIEKIFHPTEIDYCESKKEKTPSYAARFAAKEAFSKALGTGLYAEGITPKDIWIENDTLSGKPHIKFTEKVELILKTKQLKETDVSLSHHVDYALAQVILY